MRAGWRELAAALARAASPRRPALLAFDFDGTLSPIVDHPRRARLPAAEKRLLRRLAAPARRAAAAGREGAALPRARVALVSGRALADLKRRADLGPLAYYAGNHGLEVDGPGLKWVHPASRVPRRALARAARELGENFRGRPGVLLEKKGLSVSIHYRGLHAAQVRALRRELGRVAGVRGGALVVSSGKRLWELRPRLAWGKGDAVRLIARGLGRGALVLFVGDDRTDEEGFRRLGGRAVTVRVGPSACTAARFCLNGRGKMRELLSLLAGMYR